MQRMAFLLFGVALTLTGCARNGNESSAEGDTQRVTLYTSVDDEFARMVVAQFELDTGIKVDVLGDTEATKTTGLVTRLQSEKDDPSCDVWWSSEPMGTILLARDGVLEPGGMLGSVAEEWPESLRAPDWTWVGTALRRRVIVYAPGRVETPPVSMHELIDPVYKGRIGMARPQFGTTRIHMAMLAARWSPEYFEQWLGMLEENGVRMYDGNATVVRAIAMGEIDVGMTDTDDVWAGQRNGWDVDFAQMPEVRNENRPPASRFELYAEEIVIPNTVAIVKNAPNPQLAEQLAAYLTSPSVERLLYESTSGNHPVNAALRKELGLPDLSENTSFGSSDLPTFEDASTLVGEAMDACEAILGP
jgi:iron(III) transport system substrate-binding protein